VDAPATPHPGRRRLPRYVWGGLLLVPVLIAVGLYLTSGPSGPARTPGTGAASSTPETAPASPPSRQRWPRRQPDDGHRLNILSSTFTHIGIAVYPDRAGTVWMT
jgi:hypothetical protein